MQRRRFRVLRFEVELHRPRLLFDGYQVAQILKAFIADAAHDDQVLGFTEGAVFIPMFDDSFRENLADARQRFQLLSGSSIDVDSLRRLLRCRLQ